MKAIATAVGFAGRLLQPGDTFELADGSKGSWFKEVKDEAKPEVRPEGKQPGNDKARGDKPAS